MLRTLHLDTRPGWRGGQSQALLLMRGLKRCHAVELMAPRESPLVLRAQEAGITVHTVSGKFTRVATAWEIGRLLRGRKFDIVHAHDSHALTAAWLASAHHRATLITARRVAYQLAKGRLALARYRAARSIIAVSRFVAESMEGRGIDPARIAVVHDGVRIPPPIASPQREAARARWGVAEGDWVLGCVSQLSPEKGQEVLLHATALIAAREAGGNRRCRLLLAGEGRDRPRLETLARELGIVDRVIFAGFVDDVELVYGALDVFVFPSLAEPLGSSLLDAMAHGLPCIAAASGGVPEVIEDGVNGILVAAPPTPSHFATAIGRVIADHDEAGLLGGAARATVAERFSAERMVDATLAVYLEASAGR
jgi:glycosyltransferase involved in cell wall biosynthesis